MADLVYRPVIWTAKSFFAALGIRFDIVGAEHLPERGGALLAINHTSFLDYAFAGIPADLRGRRLVRFMAKDGIWRNPVAGPLMRGMRHIPVDRDQGSEAFKAAVRMLKEGELVGIFPEATMSRSFEIKELKSGAVRIAAVAGVPVIPMIVFGGQRILSYDRRDLSRGTPVAVTVGEPMTMDRTEPADDASARLADAMRGLLDATIARYPAPAPGEEPWWLPRRHGGTAPTLEEAEEIERERRARRAQARERDSD